MRGGARRGSERRAGDAEHDRAHGEVLAPAGALAEQALSEEQKHQQADRHRRLHDHERDQQQRHDLQRPAEHRQPCPREPARAAQQVERERRVQVLGLRGALGVHRLQRDP